MELRDEIVESQKVRSDLFKWKIILVASLGAVALGLASANDKGAGADPPSTHEYLLCLIPLVCLYVDILSSHLNLRIMVIGRYFQYVAATRGNEAEPRQAEYERFVERARNLTSDLRQTDDATPRTFSAFAFEDLAQHLSSSILSLFVFLWGAPSAFAGWLPPSVGAGVPRPPADPRGWFFIFAGTAGVILSECARRSYQRRLRALRGLVRQAVQEYPTEPALV